jgi:hypothetical protein
MTLVVSVGSIFSSTPRYCSLAEDSKAGSIAQPTSVMLISRQRGGGSDKEEKKLTGMDRIRKAKDRFMQL